MSVARSAVVAAMVTTLSAVCATAKPLATTGDTNLRQAPGTDSEKLALIPKGTTVEVGSCSDGWCQVSWNGQDGYAIARNLGTASSAPRPPRAPVSAETPDNERGVKKLPAITVTSPAIKRPAVTVTTPPTDEPSPAVTVTGPRGYTGPGTTVPEGPRTGYQYTGPYDERIVVSPTGIVIGTDPDPAIRAQLRRDGVGPDGNNAGGRPD